VALAAATPFLEIVGDLVVAWMWLLQAPAAARHDDVDYAAGKRAAARYFHRHFVGLIPSRCDVFPTAEDGVGDAGPAALLA
jgi:butyryl-CoA dehydrogenase